MKVLLDEDLPHKLRLNLPGHEVSTAAYRGWNGLKNGELLKTAEDEGLDVFVTGDKNLRYQQNLTERRIAVVVLAAQDWPAIEKHLAEIASAIEAATPGSFRFVAW